jgi:predicted transposase/invertase (TIGR01784 family)
MMQPVKGCYTAKVTYARRQKTVTPPNNSARALARAARRSSKNILTDFLKAVLPSLAQQEFEELTIVDPHLKRNFEDDKLEILDVKVRTAGGKSIDIEIQISDMPDMRSRISYYLSNMITEQIGRGGHYSELKQVICIVITDYDFIPESERSGIWDAGEGGAFSV